MKRFQLLGDTIVHKDNNFIMNDNSCILVISDYIGTVYYEGIPVIKFDITETEMNKLSVTDYRKVGLSDLDLLNFDDMILDIDISKLTYFIASKSSMVYMKKTSYNNTIEIKHTHDGNISIRETSNGNTYLFSVLGFNDKYNSTK